MAINIEWQMLPIQSNGTDEKMLLYPRMAKNETIDFHLFCQKVAKHGAHTKGIVEAIIYDMIDVFGELLHEGKTINFDELGTFKLSIGTNASVTTDTPFYKRDVLVRGVNFQPSKTFMHTIGTPTFRTIPRNSSATIASQDQLQRILLEYFKTHDSITRTQFEDLCKLKRTTAYTRLKALVDSGFLKKVGNNKETRYVVGTTKNSLSK